MPEGRPCLDTDNMVSKNVCIFGASEEQQKVFDTIQNNDSELGANIRTDFNHLQSKFCYINISLC